MPLFVCSSLVSLFLAIHFHSEQRSAFRRRLTVLIVLSVRRTDGGAHRLPAAPILVRVLSLCTQSLTAPPSHQVATFFLGFVFISCIHFTCHVPLAAARRLRWRVLDRGATHGADRGTAHGATHGSGGGSGCVGLEATRSPADDKVHCWLACSRSNPATSSSFPPHLKTNILALGLTVCLAMASVAGFGSLLVFDETDGETACGTLCPAVPRVLISRPRRRLSCRMGRHDCAVGAHPGAAEAEPRPAEAGRAPVGDVLVLGVLGRRSG